MSFKSSRSLFRDYLQRRKSEQDPRKGKHGSSSHASSAASSAARYLYGSARVQGSAADPASAARRKRHRSFLTLLGHFWKMLGSGAGLGSSGRALSKRAIVLLGVLTVVFSALGALALPASTKVAIDFILTDNPGPAGLPAFFHGYSRSALLWQLGVAITCINVLSLVLGIAGRWHMTRLSQHVRTQLRRRVFEHAVRLPLQRVYALKSGGAASLLREDSGQAADLLFGILYNPVRALVQLVGTLAILASVDALLLAGALLLIPAAWLSQKTFISRIRPVHRESHQLRQNIDAAAAEVFGGMRVVRGFARERKEAARFTRSAHLLARQEVLVWWWSRAIEIAWQILIPLASVAVLVYGGSRVIEASLTIGDVMMFSAYLIMLLSPLEMLSQSATGIQSQLAAFDRILDLLEEPREFSTLPPLSPLPLRPVLTAPHTPPSAPAIWQDLDRPTGLVLDPARVEGRIELRHVSFAYPGASESVLSDISLDIAPGETIALVGPSGAGKTTLCNLIARFYEPSSGVVELDARDVRSIDVRSYRSLLGIVEQDVFLFDGTVWDNITYARKNAPPEQVFAAAGAANAHAFILRLDRGYDTIVGERGVRLSGGQKQRIAIARALLANPRILILDEATSNLDTESEQLIQDSLALLMKARTCIVIAHRLSTIRSASRIAVIDNGRIVELGPHDQLIKDSGRYAGMVARQIGQPAVSLSSLP